MSAPEENEGAIAALLARRPHLTLDPVSPTGVAAGADGIGARWWPQRGRGDGHFAARLRKGVPPAAASPPPSRRASHRTAWRAATAGERGAYAAFVQERFGADPVGEHDVVAQGDTLIALPAGVPPWAWRRAGVALGAVTRDRTGSRFTPHHALSRVLPVDAQGAVVDLPADDPRVAAFLRGEALDLPGEGWCVLRADGVGLGWVKAQRGVANNHFPRGLRRTTSVAGAARVETGDESW